MPTDSGGTYSLPSGSTATTGDTILASEHNTPLNDIASALTARLPVDGSKGMSGAFKAADGSAASPSITFSSDTTTGFYKKSSGILGYSAAGTDTPLTVPAGVVLPYGGIVTPAGWLSADGSAVSRTTYANLFSAVTITGNATKDGTTDVLNSVDTDFTGYGLIGAYVEGSGIATGTTISAVTSSTITLSAIPTGTGSIAIRILPHGQGDASTTFTLPNPSGRTIAGRESTATLLTTAGSGINGARLGGTGGAQTHTLTKTEAPTGLFTLNDPGHTHTVTLESSAPAGAGSTGGNSGSVVKTTSSATTGISLTDHGGNGAHNNAQPTIVLNYIIKT